MTPVRFLLHFSFWLILGVAGLLGLELLVERWGRIISAAKKRARELE